MKSLFFALFCLVNAAVALPVSAAPSEDAAYDKSGHPVMDNRGNCVRTQWTGMQDPCAPPPPPKPIARPTPPPAPPAPKIHIAKEERIVYFDFNKSDIRADEVTKLDSLIQKINASDKIEDVRVVGYTDQIGSDSYNLELSKKRVDAVVEYVRPRLKAGIRSENPEIRGAGKAPSTECSGVKSKKERIACMQTERRVEIVLNREYSE